MSKGQELCRSFSMAIVAALTIALFFVTPNLLGELFVILVDFIKIALMCSTIALVAFLVVSAYVIQDSRKKKRA